MPEDVLIIIDDEYIEFRKALAEGKKIEYNPKRPVHNRWDEVTIIAPSQDDIIDNYRIKPEEPKFKVGDWVIHNGVTKQVTKVVDGYIDSLDNEVVVIMKEESLELWKPKEKEYFWYKNDLVKFDESQSNAGLLLQSARGCSYHVPTNFEKYCEPFIGQLPSNLK